MKIIVLGSTGMLGHMVYEYFTRDTKHDVVGFCRFPRPYCNERKFELGVSNIKQSLKLILNEKPDVVINCIGLLIKECQNFPERAAFINSLFPRLLEGIFSYTPCRVVQISSDCVFLGGYCESLMCERYDTYNVPDETSIYGITKHLGEIINKKDLTIRTSIIGPELDENGVGLFNWFTHQKGKSVKGYTNAIWNGVTTLQLAKFIEISINGYYDGLIHYGCSNPISKCHLLKLINSAFDCGVEVESCNEPVNVKTLKMLAYIRRNTVCIENQILELKDFVHGCKHL